MSLFDFDLLSETHKKIHTHHPEINQLSSNVQYILGPGYSNGDAFQSLLIIYLLYKVKSLEETVNKLEGSK